MVDESLRGVKVGWIGTGRMGFAMARRLARVGVNLTVYNRTRAKAEPLTDDGACIADSLRDLASCDVVFTMVSTSDDLKQVFLGQGGLLSASAVAARIFVDCSSVSSEASLEVRAALSRVGSELIASPISGNPKVVKAGKAAFVASGPEATFEKIRPFLEIIAPEVSYVGAGERARIVKICHNVFLGVVTQSIAELLVLAERAGVSRHAFLEFLNKSVMGSVFTKYKSPALVNLDFTTTFTPVLMRKDLDLGLAAAREYGVPMPLAVNTHALVQSCIGRGHEDVDFSILLQVQASNSGMKLEPENVAVDDGLSEK